MIFFAPAYDGATHLNLAIAEAIRPATCHALFGAAATRESLLDALDRAPGDSVLAMCHGEKERLLAQNLTTIEALGRAGVRPEEWRERLEAGQTTALTVGDAAAIGQRTLFVFACHTASKVGRDLTAAGAVYWGYTGAINAPAENPELAFLFLPIFEHIRDAWSLAGTVRERTDVLTQIAALCEQAEERLDDMVLGDGELDAGSAYLCLLHLWDRLRIWTPNAESPEHHPRATMPLFLM